MTDARYFRLGVGLGLVVLLFACTHRQTAPVNGGAPFDPLTPILDFYEGPLDHLSAVRVGQCPMHPSCSAYARQCTARFGLVIGWVMACDRLLRCGRDEVNLAPEILVDGRRKTYDPVAADFP